MFKCVSTLLFLFYSTLVASAPISSLTYQDQMIQDKKIKIGLPKGWEAVKDLYGLPLVALGPWANESRPAISWMYTGMTTKIMKDSEFQKLFVDFKKDKEEWLKGHAGKLLKFDGPTTSNFENKLRGHFIGAEFVVNDVHFIERSYYLYCSDEVYNVKWSIRQEHSKYIQDIEKIVGSLQCVR
jgi:hypothetical protein